MSSMSSPPLPRPYQTEGADFLASRDMALLGDDPGLGKTREAIMAMERVQAERTLIICPAVARLVWPAEIRRWSTSPAPVRVLDPEALKSQSRAGDVLMREMFAPAAGITVVVAFDTISVARHWALVQMLGHVAWDVIIIDEGHRLAHAGSKRTQRIYGERLNGRDGIIERAARVWVLTGTPTPNHAGELYTHARALFPEAILIGERTMEEHEFIERYCRYRDTVHGRQITGSQNLPELRARMKNRVLRRRKTDVLKELPPMDFVVVPVPGTALRAPDMDEAVPPGLEGDELVAYLASHAVHLATLRRLLGEAKLRACVDWLIDLLESGTRKVVVFAHHVGILTEAVALLAEYNPVSVTGETSDKQRRTAIERFQAEPGTRVFLGQIDACGTAITLTAAHDVVMFECSWVPGANYQAASRCHRLGQRDGVLVRMLCVPDSLDQRIVATFQRKANEIAQLWD